MKEIILTEEQARILAEAQEPVEVRDAAGTILWTIDPIDARVLASHRQRRQAGAEEPGVPAEQIQAYLRRLQEEWDTHGPFDQKRADELFEQMNVREE